MKIKAYCALSNYAHVAKQKTVIDIDPEEIDGLTEDEKEVHINNIVWEWATQEFDTWYEEE